MRSFGTRLRRRWMLRAGLMPELDRFLEEIGRAGLVIVPVVALVIVVLVWWF